MTFWENWEAEYAASLPACSIRVRLGPLAQRHRDDLGALAPRAVAEEPPDTKWLGRADAAFDDRRVAVAALLALAPEIEIISPDDVRDDLLAVARQTIERLTIGVNQHS